MNSSIFEYLDIFLLVLVRMGGPVFINPVFSHRGVPPMIRIGLVLTPSLLITPGVRSGAGQVMAFSIFNMVESLIREAIPGLVIDCVFHIFFCMFYVAGDLLDTVFGLTMGKIMGPVGGVQISIPDQLVDVLFYLYFFVTGYHLTVVRLFAYSYQVVPVRAGAILGGRILWYIMTLSGSVFLMVIKLVLLFVAVEFTLEMIMGVFVKLIPQIHVFVVNIQCKILLGIILMMLLTYSMGAFMDRYAEAMMMETQKLPIMLG